MATLGVKGLIMPGRSLSLAVVFCFRTRLFFCVRNLDGVGVEVITLFYKTAVDSRLCDIHDVLYIRFSVSSRVSVYS